MVQRTNESKVARRGDEDLDPLVSSPESDYGVVMPLESSRLSRVVGKYDVAAALVLVQFLFALNAAICGDAVKRADPVVFSFLRDALGSLVLLAAAWFSPDGLVVPRREDVWAFVVIGIGGVYLGQLFLLIALTYVTVLNAMVVDSLIPVFTLVLGHFLGLDRLKLSEPRGWLRAGATLAAVFGAVLVAASQAPLTAVATAVGTAGTAESPEAAADHAASGVALSGASSSSYGGGAGGDILAPQGGFEGGPAAGPVGARVAPHAAAEALEPAGEKAGDGWATFIAGNAFALIFAVGGSTYPLMQKHVLATTNLPPLSVAAWGYVAGTCAIALTLPVCHLKDGAAAWSLLGGGGSAGSVWLALAYVVLVTTAFNYGVMAWCNARSSPSFVTAFAPLKLVFTALVALLRGAPLGLVDALGCALVCGGLLALARSSVPDAAASAAAAAQSKKCGKDEEKTAESQRGGSRTRALINDLPQFGY
mmetsp:Transcript_26671/g.59653  ORF Transcript_26671/g.59653 Transcript_26671/m.59653 type:complete len:479 (-) Transcript_26671:71-1507(-)